MKNLILAILLCAPIHGADLTLTWNDNSDNEVGYSVERSVDDGEFVQLGTVEAGIVEYTDADVPLGVTLSYRVFAWNAYGDSGFSNVVAEITSPPLGPDGLKFKKGNPFAKFFKRLMPKRNKRS